jgi:UDP-N-acetylmuramoyl-tripeptide--D-alanyl-D-alanine ligase
MEISKLHQLFLSCNSVSTDTRSIEKNDLFFCLKGENFNGNLFVSEALSKGASFVVIDAKDAYVDERTILVEDSLITLQQLGLFHRKHINIPIIALTGSNGKTTTKELIYHVLNKKYHVNATKGNLNNHIGVPLTLLSFNTETQFGIVEMGANHQKEIAFLCRIAEPNYGYITNFGKAHLEGFGGVEGVIKGKSEMYDFFKTRQGLLFVNQDDPIQVEKTENLERFTFGKSENANVCFSNIQANPFVEFDFQNTHLSSNLIGMYNAANIMVAATIGIHFDVSVYDIVAAIKGYTPTNNRSQIITLGSNQIILDAYNANPSSMSVAIQHFLNQVESNKILILGDMFELGDESEFEHQNIVGILSQDNTVEVYFVGNHFYKARILKDNFKFFEDFDAFSSYLEMNTKFEKKYILIKGSRGMKLERTLDYIS